MSNMNAEPTKATYRERVLGVYDQFQQEREETLQLLDSMTPAQREFKSAGAWSATDYFEHMVIMQQWLSRITLYLSWFRPLLVRKPQSAEREFLDDPFIAQPLQIGRSWLTRPKGKETYERMRSLNKTRIRTLRQRLNCFEHHEWLLAGFYHPGLKRSLSMLQWVWYLIYSERHHREQLKRNLQQPDFPK